MNVIPISQRLFASMSDREVVLVSIIVGLAVGLIVASSQAAYLLGMMDGVSGVASSLVTRPSYRAPPGPTIEPDKADD